MTIAYPPKHYRILQRFGYGSDRNLYWSCRKERNFGDWLSPLLFEKLSGREAVFCMPKSLKFGSVTLGVGSVLHWVKKDRVADVWGSGIKTEDAEFRRPRHVHAVRGPRTRRRILQLGYDCGETYGDPALLTPIFFPRERNPDCEIGIVPHFVDYEIAQRLFSETRNIRIIDVTRPPMQVVDEITSCRCVASSSLHGIILAHAYGVPAMQLVFSNLVSGDGVKFADYAESFHESNVVECIDLQDASPNSIDLDDIVDKADLPDVRLLQKGLIESCPFILEHLRKDALLKVT